MVTSPAGGKMFSTRRHLLRTVREFGASVFALPMLFYRSGGILTLWQHFDTLVATRLCLFIRYSTGERPVDDDVHGHTLPPK